MRRMLLVAVVAVLNAFVGRGLAAQPAYLTDFTTSGIFSCFAQAHYSEGSCAASGNSVTIANGGSTLTYTFTGVSNWITATNSSQVVSLGTISATLTGDRLVLPTTRSGVPLYFMFLYALHSTTPVSVRGGQIVTGALINGEILPSGDTGFGWTLPVDAVTRAMGYNMLVYGVDAPRFLLTNGSADVIAHVSLVPEPSSIALLATGCVSLLGTAWRRKSRFLRSA